MKILWVDLETTGLDSKKNNITELAGIYQDTKTKEEIEFHKYIQYDEYPENYEEVSKITGLTPEILKEKGIQNKECYREFIQLLSVKVNKYDKKDKIIFAAYNAKFDNQFLREFFKKNNDDYFGSYFFSCCLDVFSTVAESLLLEKISPLKSHSLENLCEHLNIKINAHSAISDIKATRTLYKKLRFNK